MYYPTPNECVKGDPVVKMFTKANHCPPSCYFCIIGREDFNNRAFTAPPLSRWANEVIQRGPHPAYALRKSDGSVYASSLNKETLRVRRPDLFERDGWGKVAHDKKCKIVPHSEVAVMHFENVVLASFEFLGVELI